MTGKKERQSKEEIIAKIQQRIDEEIPRIMAEIEVEMKKEEMDFGSIEKMVRDKVLRFGSALLEGSVQINGTGYSKSRIPCKCGGKKEYVGNRKKKRQR